MLALLGPSGCGKTTCLRLIAGFERPDRAASTWMAGASHRRRAWSRPSGAGSGFVFQDLALFPHLTARQNIAYGIRRDPDRPCAPTSCSSSSDSAPTRDRLPHELSGGMQQRVALARALAPRPDVLLLDEPFSTLDQAMRTQLRAEVRQILRDARQSAIFVTHDQAEALTIADHVAVMARGQVLQVATPELIYAEPETPFVATFVGVANLVSADVQRRRGRDAARPGPPRRARRAGRSPGHALCLLATRALQRRGGPRRRRHGGRVAVVIERRFSGSRDPPRGLVPTTASSCGSRPAAGSVTSGSGTAFESPSVTSRPSRSVVARGGAQRSLRADRTRPHPKAVRSTPSARDSLEHARCREAHETARVSTRPS